VNVGIADDASTPAHVTAEVDTEGNDPLAQTSTSSNVAIQAGSYLDDDGVFNAVEDGAPNSGDGNGDGTADSEQDTVTSLVNPVSGNYATLETGGCSETNHDVSLAAEPTAYADDTYVYPVGLMDFSLDCDTPGGTATVTQYFYGDYDASKIVARKYDSTTHAYQTIPDAVISNVSVGGQAALKIVYDITDGSALDQDGAPNGTIIDPSGPALLVETIGSPGTTNTAISADTPNTGLIGRPAVIYYGTMLVGAALLSYGIRQRNNRRIPQTHHR
jgi:hypothetical protein